MQNNDNNEYLIGKFRLMMQKCKPRSNKAMGLKKVIRTIETFPLPIVSGRMAMTLVCNIGGTHAGNIDNWLRNR